MVFALVAEQAGPLLDMDAVGVARFIPMGSAEVVGAWPVPEEAGARRWRPSAARA